VQRDRGSLEPLELEMALEEPAQAAVGNQVIAGPEEAHEAAQRVERKDLPATEPAPHSRQLVRGLGCLRSGSNECAVQGPDRGSDDQVRRELAFVERTQHADLDRA
jgi:hypothetical protein